MQDIDFEALDQEVNKIMDQKKQAAEKQARIRQYQGRGRNMDIVNTAHTPAQPTPRSHGLSGTSVVNGVSHAQPQPLNTNRGPMVDGIRRVSAKPNTPASARPQLTTQRSFVRPPVVKSQNLGQPQMIPAQSTSRPQVTAPVKAKTITPPQAVSASAVAGATPAVRGANLLRQRRRLNQAGEAMVSTVMAPLANSSSRSDSLVTGHYQSETLSTKQPDGSETVYQYDSLNYVAKVAPEAVAPSQIANHRQLSDTNAQRSVSMVDLDELAELESIHPTETKSKLATRPHDDPVYRDRGQSPFLETAKVDKRPLGVPYDKAKDTPYNRQSTLQLDNQSDDEEDVALYRGDLKTDDKPSRLNSVIWIVLTIVAIVGAAVGIYLLTVYNK